MKRTGMLRLRVSASERRVIERDARARGLSVSAWLRQLALHPESEREHRKAAARAALGKLPAEAVRKEKAWIERGRESWR